jgi:hypothetical protein
VSGRLLCEDSCEVGIADDVVLRGGFTKPAREEREVAIHRRLAVLLHEEVHVGRQRDVEGTTCKRQLDTNARQHLIAAEVRATVAPYVQVQQATREQKGREQVT